MKTFEKVLIIFLAFAFLLLAGCAQKTEGSITEKTGFAVQTTQAKASASKSPEAKVPAVVVKDNTKIKDTEKCTDSDNGIFFSKKGTLIAGSRTFTDSCKNTTAANILTEYYCDSKNKLEYSSYKTQCQYGCTDGICLSKATVNIAESNKKIEKFGKWGSGADPLEEILKDKDVEIPEAFKEIGKITEEKKVYYDPSPSASPKPTTSRTK